MKGFTYQLCASQASIGLSFAWWHGAPDKHCNMHVLPRTWMAVKGPALFYTCTSKYGKVCCREKAAGTSRRGEYGEQEITGSRTGYEEEGSRQDSSLQGQGAQLSMLQLSLVSPGQKYRCLSFNGTQMPGANVLPMVTLGDWLSSQELSASKLYLSLRGRYQSKDKRCSVYMSL